GEFLVARLHIGLTKAVESVGRFRKGHYCKLEDGDGLVCLADAEQVITFVVDPPLNNINALLSFLARLEPGRRSFFLGDADHPVRKCPVRFVVRDRYYRREIRLEYYFRNDPAGLDEIEVGLIGEDYDGDSLIDVPVKIRIEDPVRPIVPDQKGISRGLPYGPTVSVVGIVIFTGSQLRMIVFLFRLLRQDIVREQREMPFIH